MFHRRTLFLLAILGLAVIAGVVAGRHFTAASATTAHPTTVAQAEARAAFLANEAAVGRLDRQGTAELHELIRKFHLVPTGPSRCVQQTDATNQLDCKIKLGFTQAHSAS